MLYLSNCTFENDTNPFVEKIKKSKSSTGQAKKSKENKKDYSKERSRKRDHE